ncbi:MULTISPECIES: bacillithiol biosynthesis deacetylase BshB2 [Fictibacillus]|uniref:Bacillithiol biosynthesis deacetylase BshB2 n=1 Tax=Fictibacillus enclensis TaxID=1017270 RepID=A0A0V8J1Z0_9BACL|nr:MULTISPECIES: bacillithiol biosynthesis deacetylase BshB2 [Fictibacillus]KSU80939.1 bacillithiol biosynthesis deacetylase BshB2 [Fictibacillus enclensis]RXZ00473.1 bacillithiol biosynthesis deacetylase BshB2 [Fictibacillus sp. S7]SCC33175.1 bacillithiol biosynthesis deacetylase BshB2 [Fictibacillus enclensis]
MSHEHVLVVFPHPDDEAFGVSGTIAMNTEKGVPVTYVCLTLGEMGRNMGNPPFATRESLPKIRKKELQAAADTLNIQDLRMWGLRDKTVEFEDPKTLTARIGNVIDELKPTLIITFYPGYSVHPDHEATGRAVIRAVEQLPEDRRPTVHCVAFSNDCYEMLGEPDVVKDVSSVSHQKLEAIKAHRSQTEWIIAAMAEENPEKVPEVLKRINKEQFWTYKF